MSFKKYRDEDDLVRGDTNQGVAVSAAVAVGITMGPVGWAVLAISSGVAGGIVGSYFGDKVGGVIGRKF